MPANTTYYQLIVPTVGGDADQWGNYLNNDLDSIDELLKKIQTNNLSVTAPVQPTLQADRSGSFWIDNTDPANWVMKIFDGNNWNLFANINTSTHQVTFPGSSFVIGQMIMFAGLDAAIPSGWLKCDGTLYDGTISTYEGLWNVIGTTYGGTGQSSFAVPNLTDKFAMAAGVTYPSGTIGGSDNYLLAVNQLPNHAHTLTYAGGKLASANGLPSSAFVSQNYNDQTVALNQTGLVVGNSTPQPIENKPPFQSIGSYIIYAGV